ncbi:MAG: ABC transporter permease [Candidatus Kariarchaeaceae archaeon]
MGSLRSFIMMRIALLIPMIWLLVTIVFFLLRVLPGANPALVMNPQLTDNQIALMNERFGLDKPIFEQYIDFIIRAMQFDFGISFRSNDYVASEIQQAFGLTLMLGSFGTLIGVPLGIFLGGVSGANRDNIKDHATRLYTIGIYSIPIFLVGIILQMLFSKSGFFVSFLLPFSLLVLGLGLIGIFSSIILKFLSSNNSSMMKLSEKYFKPMISISALMSLFGLITYIIFPLPALSPMRAGATGEFEKFTNIWIIDTLLSGRPDLTYDLILHLILPSVALGMLIAAVIARQVRTNMIFQLEQDYVHFARSRGIPENTVKYRYALKNAVIPAIGLISLQFALLLAGAILTETTFNIPGLGRYLFLALSEKDFPAVQGVMIVFVLVVSIVSLLSDVLYAILDPRITY